MSQSKTYIYKIYDGVTYLGTLDSVISEFQYSQDINSSAVSVNVKVQQSADVATLPVEAILDEGGNPILDENDNIIYEERRPDVIGSFNPNALIQEYNKIKIYEFHENNVNGDLVFDGYIESWFAEVGSDNDIIEFTAISNGVDLADYIVNGSPYAADVTQNDDNNLVLLYDYPSYILGQTFTTGASTTNIAAISIFVANSQVYDVDITLRLYTSVPTSGFGTPVASVTKTLPAVTLIANEFTMTFDTPYACDPSTEYFFTVRPSVNGANLPLLYQDANPYAGGKMYVGSGISPFVYQPTPTAVVGTASDMRFITYEYTGATTVNFSNQDPSTMLTDTIDTYNVQGGSVTYTGSSIDATGDTTSYTFNTATVLDGVKKFLSLAPSDWYWYVNPATQVIYFKQTATTATHRFIKGKHVIGSFPIGGTVENVRNIVYFTGGDTGGGDNLFTNYTNQTSIDAGKRRLELLTDNRVTTTATADLISNNFLNENSSISYVTTLTVSANDYDISTINIGDTIKVVGYGNFIDSLILQIVRLVRKPDSVDISLGMILKRQSDQVAQVLKDLNDLQTVNNPTTPS